MPTTRSAGPAARTERAPDPTAQAKRLEERLALMTSGMDDFARWLGDLARGGTASVRSQPYTWWDTTAARLVDAQLPGLADQVPVDGVRRRHPLGLAGAPPRRDGPLVDRDAGLVAASGGGRRRRGRPAYRPRLVGLAPSRCGSAIPSTTGGLVLGAHRTDDGRLQQQRTWLRGQASGETVQVLDFAAGGQVLPMARVVGSVLDATLARYPGKAVHRALFVDEPVLSDARGGLADAGSVDAAHAKAAATWAVNPWAWRVPVALEHVRATVLDRGGGAGRPGDRRGPVGEAVPVSAALVDEAGDALRLTEDSPVWPLLALTGGHPTDVFAELEGQRARPLSAVVDGELVAL